MARQQHPAAVAAAASFATTAAAASAGFSSLEHERSAGFHPLSSGLGGAASAPLPLLHPVGGLRTLTPTLTPTLPNPNPYPNPSPNPNQVAYAPA